MQSKFKRFLQKESNKSFLIITILELKKISSVLVMGLLAVLIIEKDNSAYHVLLALLVFVLMLYLIKLESIYYESEEGK